VQGEEGRQGDGQRAAGELGYIRVTNWATLGGRC
jgi:hypothetical protein